MTTNGMRPGFRTLTPYLTVSGARQLIEFAKRAFKAEELDVHGDEGRIFHAEMQIGDSKIELADTPEGHADKPAALHLYLPNADEIYLRAIDAGATSLMPPADMPYGDREGGVQDALGNQWYIATHLGATPVRENLSTVTICLRVEGVDKLLEFLKSAFDAEVLIETPPYYQVRIGDSVIEPSQARGDFGAIQMAIHHYVPDADAAYRRALRAGANSLSAPADMPYGERNAGVCDPFGNSWYLATWKG